MSDYDFLIVGAGLFGATCARLLADAGKRVAVIEKRDHIGGNCYTEVIDGIVVHKYGGHIFHTNSRKIWDFVNQFTAWKQYEHRVKVYADGKYYSFPPNRMTLQQLGNPNGDAKQVIKDKFFVGYSEKQWGWPFDQIPDAIIKRIPIRDNWDDRYFTDVYQGLPLGGYTPMFESLLDGIPLRLGEDFLQSPEYWKRKTDQIIYTGEIDRLFDFCYGYLEYRSLSFVNKTVAGDYQGCATVNYPSKGVDFTRIMEWKHFAGQGSHENSVITFEYPCAYDGTNEPYYPIRDQHNAALYERYHRMLPPWLIVGGRLGSYQYLNMDQAIGAAMKLTDKLL